MKQVAILRDHQLARGSKVTTFSVTKGQVYTLPDKGADELLGALGRSAADVTEKNQVLRLAVAEVLGTVGLPTRSSPLLPVPCRVCQAPGQYTRVTSCRLCGDTKRNLVFF